MEKVLFQEEQRFAQWWIWVLMFIALLVVILSVVNSIVSEQVSFTSSNSRLFLYGFTTILFILVFVLVTLFVRLKTKITYDGVFIAYLPFKPKWKRITKEEIKSYEIRKYGAIREYGGYGMKNKRKMGRAFTISGNIGLQLYLKDGKKILIGTHKKQAIKYAMDKLCADIELSPKPEKILVTRSEPWLAGKAKKVLIIFALELALILVIYGIIELFNAF